MCLEKGRRTSLPLLAIRAYMKRRSGGTSHCRKNGEAKKENISLHPNA